MSVPSEKFAAQMEFLAGSSDINLLTQHDVNTILSGKGPPPGNGVFLTFDDGYRNTVTDVLPVLERHGIPATIAVCSSYLLPRFSPLQTVHHSQDFASASDPQALARHWPRRRQRITRLFVDPEWSQAEFESALAARLVEERVA